MKETDNEVARDINKSHYFPFSICRDQSPEGKQAAVLLSIEDIHRVRHANMVNLPLLGRKLNSESHIAAHVCSHFWDLLVLCVRQY